MVESTDVMRYGWVDVEVVGTPSIINVEAAIEVVGIVINDPQDWSILLVDPEKNICRSFDECTFPRYECMFIRIGL